MYETSQQAQFLKPTVITLVYGLGFGMLLVLLVVPSFVAIQADLGRPLTSIRRGLRATRLKPLLWGGALLQLLWLGLTLGYTMAAGKLHPALASLGFVDDTSASLRLAFLSCLLGFVVIAAVLYALGSLGLVRGSPTSSDRNAA